MRKFVLAAVLFPPAVLAASCSQAQSGDSGSLPFRIEEVTTFDVPWAAAFEPGTNTLFVTEKKGTMKFIDLDTGKIGEVSGIPEVSFGGQGGFADVAFAPDYATSKGLYLSWVKAGPDNTRYGVVGLGKLDCSAGTSCAVKDLREIWRQEPALSTFGQFAVRLAFSPDRKYLFVASGELAKGDPAQDTGNNLGKIVRLNLDGTAAAGNPFADKPSPTNQIWTYGHRNPLGLKFDLTGQLYDLEHGPRGGDEINLLVPGNNYGWPLVSGGDNYDGTPIPKNGTRPDLAQPAIMWNPVIAPGDFLFYSGKLWPEWKNQALIAGLATQSVVRVSLKDGKGTEEARYKFDQRLREIVEAPDGSLYLLEDRAGGRLLHLTPNK